MDELIKALTGLARAATAYLERQNGVRAITFKEVMAAVAAAIEDAPKQTRTKKVSAVPATVEDAPKRTGGGGLHIYLKKPADLAAVAPAEDPFAIKASVAKSNVKVNGKAVSIEEQIEAKRRCQEVMGLFIRRYLKSTPSGLDRAKQLIQDVCGHSIGKLEYLTHAENMKLIPRFEIELEAVDGR